MKKIWFNNLAIAVTLLSAAQAAGQQFPGVYGNYAPSSYPIQAPGAGAQTSLADGRQSTAQSDSDARATPFQFVAIRDQQDAVDSLPAPAAPQPQPAPSITSLPAPPADFQQGYPPSAPATDYGYQQAIAPNCSSCGPAPISQPHTGYAGSNWAATTAHPIHRLWGHGAQPHAGWGEAVVGGSHAHHGVGLPAGAKPWFFGGNYLYYERIDEHSRPLALQDSDSTAALTTRDARTDSMHGFEVMGGRYFNCGRNAIQASYWGLYPGTEERTVNAPGGSLSCRTLAPGDVQIDVAETGLASAGYDVYDWYDNAAAHRIQRSSQYHNVEVNLLGFGVGHAARNFNRATGGSLFSGSHCGSCGGAGCGACAGASNLATGPTGYIAPACGSRLNLSWLAGIRYFRFQDELEYAADFNGNGFTGAVDDLYYDVNTTNDLVGFQLGGRGDYRLGRRINLYSTGKVGVYSNYSTLDSRIGTATIAGYGAGAPAIPYDISESDTRVAFLSELGSGIGFRVSSKWTATVGYSILAASGVATSTGNVRNSGDLLRDQRYIDNQDTLILHGLNVGALYNF